MNTNSSQWIQYDGRFEKFYNFLAENFTDAIIVEDTDIVEYEEIIEKDSEHCYSDSERIKAIEKLCEQYPGLMDDNSKAIDDLQHQIKLLQESKDTYTKLLPQMR